MLNIEGGNMEENPDIIVLGPPKPKVPEFIDLSKEQEDEKSTYNANQFPLTEIHDYRSQNNIHPGNSSASNSENYRIINRINHISVSAKTLVSNLKQDSQNFWFEKNSVSDDLELFYKVADWLRLNKEQYENPCSALVSCCAHFTLPLHLVPKTYSARHISEQNVIYSYTIKIKDIVLTEDVSRDQHEALERAVKKACDLIMTRSICIETNERGVLCLKKRQQDLSSIVNDAPMGRRKRRKMNNLLKKNLAANETTKGTKRKKVNKKKQFKVSINNRGSVRNSNKKSKIMPLEFVKRATLFQADEAELENTNEVVFHADGAKSSTNVAKDSQLSLKRKENIQIRVPQPVDADSVTESVEAMQGADSIIENNDGGLLLKKLVEERHSEICDKDSELLDSVYHPDGTTFPQETELNSNDLREQDVMSFRTAEQAMSSQICHRGAQSVDENDNLGKVLEPESLQIAEEYIREILNNGKILYVMENAHALFVSQAKLKFFIYDESEITNNYLDKQILNCSAAYSNVKIAYNYHDSQLGGNCFKNCEIGIKNQIVCKAIAKTKDKARKCAIVGALGTLSKMYYSIKEKRVQLDDFIITPSKLCDESTDISALGEDNIGCKMLKSMGWSGGAIGKTGRGITKPIKLDATYSRGKGLGFSDQKTSEHSFHVKIDSILSEYAASQTTSDLMFSSQFSKQQHHKIECKVVQHNMKAVFRTSHPGKELIISRKYPLRQLYHILVKAGGSTEKYELIPPTG